MIHPKHTSPAAENAEAQNAESKKLNAIMTQIAEASSRPWYNSFVGVSSLISAIAAVIAAVASSYPYLSLP